MDRYEEYFKMHEREIMILTHTYLSYAKGIIIVYTDEAKTETLVQFNLMRFEENIALNYGLLNYIVETIKYIKDRKIIV